MIVLALRSADSTPAAQLLDSEARELLKRCRMRVLSDDEELILTGDAIRLGFECAYEWRVMRPSLIAVMGEADDSSDSGLLTVADRARRLRFLLDQLTEPCLCVVGGASQKLAPFITDLAATPMGHPRFKDGLADEEVRSYAAPSAIQSAGSLRGLELVDHNLPFLMDSFVGREKELAELPDLVLSHAVTTLTGCGGTGKTRLALHSAAETALRGFEVVRFFRLADVPGGSNVGDRMAEQAGIQSGRLEDFIKAYKGKEVLLLVDNCEHVIDSARDAVRQIVSELPRARIIATSRESLGLAGEQAYEVDPLGLPDPEEEDWEARWPEFGALKMLDDRLRERDHKGGLNDENIALACSICRRIDGLPLAIEHIAGQAAAIGLKECERLLDENFELLVSSRPDIEPRHRTIKAAIDWSYRLLSKPERRLLENMAVFVGSFTREDVEAVCADEVVPATQTLHLATSLVNKSIVTRLYSDADELRYQLLELVREYGMEKCGDRMEGLRRKWFDRVAEQISQAYITSTGAKGEYSFGQISDHYSGVRSCLEWALDNGVDGGQLACYQMNRYWIDYGPIADGLKMLRRILPAADHEMSDLELDICNALGVMVWLTEDPEGAEPFFRQVAKEAESRGDSVRLGIVLANLGGLALNASRFEEAEPLLVKSVDLLMEGAEYVRAVRAVNMLCFAYNRTDRAAQSQELILEVLDRQGISSDLSIILRVNLTDSYIAGKEYEQAREVIRVMLTHPEAQTLTVSVAPGILRAAQLAVYACQPDVAAELLGLASAAFVEQQGGNNPDRERIIADINSFLDAHIEDEKRKRCHSKGMIVPPERRNAAAVRLLNALTW